MADAAGGVPLSELINPLTGRKVPSKTSSEYYGFLNLIKNRKKFKEGMLARGANRALVIRVMPKWSAELRYVTQMKKIPKAPSASLIPAFTPAPAPVFKITTTQPNDVYQSDCFDALLRKQGLVFDKFLGSGVYGSVYMACTSIDRKCEYVVKIQKIVKMRSMNKPRSVYEDEFMREFRLAAEASKDRLAPQVYQTELCDNVRMSGENWLAGMSIMEKWDMDMWKAGAAKVCVPDELLHSFALRTMNFFRRMGIENSDGLRGPNLLCKLDGKLVTAICIGDWGLLDNAEVCDGGDCFAEWTKWKAKARADAKAGAAVRLVGAITGYVKEMGHPNTVYKTLTTSERILYKSMKFTSAELNKKAVY